MKITRHPLFLLTLSNLKEFWREPGAIFWALFFPVLISGGLGLAFTKKGEPTQKIAFVSTNPTTEESWTRRIGNETTGFTNYEFLPVSYDEGLVLLKRGTVDVIITQADSTFQYHFDPMNPEAQLAYMNLTNALSKSTPKNAGTDVTPLTDIGSRYIDFLVPGLMAMSAMMSCMWGISYSMIEKRSKKLLRRMVATPMRKTHFMLATLMARTILCAAEATLLILFAIFAFDVAITGSLSALILLFLAGIFMFAGIAVLAASRTANTYVGNGIINAVVMPMMILSGIFFSYQGFPTWAISIIKLMPLTIFADTCRAIFIEGAGWHQILLPLSVLVIIGTATFGLGLKAFRWY